MKVRNELVIVLVLLVFCIINYFILIPHQIVAEGSSSIYPNLINFMLLAFTLVYGVEVIRCMRKETSENDGAKISIKGFFSSYGRTIILIVLTGGWILAMDIAGFILSSVIFLLAASQVFGSRSLWKSAALSLIMPFLFYGLFRGLNSLLPEGPVESLLSNLIG